MVKNKTKQLLAVLVCGAISLGGAGQVLAAEAEETFALDEYVVTANRVPVKANKVAANVTVIDSVEIEKGAYSKVSDILQANNINMGTTSFASYPILNGDDRVLVLVDGRKMNWSHLVVSGNSRAVNIDNVPVSNIERIEIVRGPNSALYGSDAVGGVINIITKKAAGNKTTVRTEYGTWNTQRYTLTTEGVDGDISYMFTYDKQKRGNFDYKSPITHENREFNSSEIDREYQSLKLEKQLKDDNSLSLEIERKTGNDGYGVSLKNVTTGVVTYPNSNRSDEDLNFALTYNWNNSKGSNDYFRVYRNHNEVTANYSNYYTHDLTAIGAEWQQNWTLHSGHTLVGGAEVRKEKFDEINGTANSQGEQTTTAIFMQNSWDLNDNWSVTVGNRFEDNSSFGSDVTSNLSINKVLSDNSNIYLSWGQAVKNPTLKQRYADTASWIGNPNLKQEEGQTFTLGYNSKLAADTSLQASVYSSKLKNAIAWDQITSTQGMYVNVNREKRRGLDLQLTKRLSDQWSVNTGYSYARIEKKSSSGDDYAADLLNSRPNGYTFGVKYFQDKWDGGVTLLAASGRSTKAYTDNSFMTVDAILNYQADKNTRLYFKGLNLTNEAYELISYSAVTAGKYPIPGRSFILGIERTF
ncbi:TonB-dependent receptor plug domain-containing protein [Sporomusa aerivorans]|uniref:TonB-dependent receptor plug domain-containing protein n=1 Tax=Sporomusa aerivorans TaxID=204936 RepID=UPI00352AC815